MLGKSLSPICAVFVMVLGGCAGLEGDLETFMGEVGNMGPSPAAFRLCHGYGCSDSSAISLNAEEWQSVRAVFDPPAPNAAAEREQIRAAIARLEALSGEKSSTRDIGGTFRTMGGRGQMDCVDEMLNTATYLTLMAEDGLLSFHEPHRRVTATFFTAGFWPHTAASVVDRTDGSEYVIDSSFLDNGAPPFVIPLAEWRAGSWREAAGV